MQCGKGHRPLAAVHLSSKREAASPQVLPSSRAIHVTFALPTTLRTSQRTTTAQVDDSDDSDDSDDNKT